MKTSEQAILKLLLDAREALIDGRTEDLHGILTGDICSEAIENYTTGLENYENEERI